MLVLKMPPPRRYWQTNSVRITVKPVLSGHFKRRPKLFFVDQLLLNGEHSVILLTFNKLPFVIKIFVLSIFEWPLKTGFTVPLKKLVYKELTTGLYCMCLCSAKPTV